MPTATAVAIRNCCNMLQNHWRSFQATARPYPKAPEPSRWFTPLAAVLLLQRCRPCVVGSSNTDHPDQRSAWLPGWLPGILGVLTLSYAGRYWRYRLLLNAEGLGHRSRRDAVVWFQPRSLPPASWGAFAVQQLHQQLGYPRPLLHAFLAERLATQSR